MEEIIISFGIILVISFILYFFTKLFNNKKQNNTNIQKDKIISGNIIPYSFSKTPYKILKEEDHVTCFLYLLNKDFISGQMNGMISYYNGENYKAILLIIEHCEPITSLFQLHDQTILTSSADGTMKKIKILLNNDNSKKKYLVEFVFYTNREFIFKSIQLENNDDILSCNIAKEFILWKKNKNDDYPLYKVEKILLKNEYVRDILQVNDKNVFTTGENLICWNTNYEIIKKLTYNCKGNNCIYKINDELTGILLQNDGDILLFNNNTLTEIKIINLSSYSLTCLKTLENNLVVIGIFDKNNLKSLINQYIIHKIPKGNENNNNNDNNTEIELIKIKSENINYNLENSFFQEKNWQRINTIDIIGNNIILGLGGRENLKNCGNLIIVNNN